MAEKLLMPKLGMAQSYCVIEKWVKKPGDQVKKGDVLVEVSTDKITYEIESKTDGYLLKITRQEGEEVPVQEVIAYIGQPGEEIQELLPDEGKSYAPGGLQRNSRENSISGPQVIQVSPLAKKIISDNGLDAGKIMGSGPAGRIMKEDVIEYINKNKDKEQKSEAYAKGTSITASPKILRTFKLEGIRKIIAEKMVYSKQNIPHISQSVNIDVTDLLVFKESLSKEVSVKITLSDLILKAVSLALKINPDINSAFIDGEHIIYSDINPGLVTSIDNGLIIPVIKNCDQLSIREIAVIRNELVERARLNNLSVEDISGGTFTITNLGMYNIRSCTAIIYPPQAAILSVGGIFSSVEVMQNGETLVRKIMDVAVSEDHRVLDGAAGAKFISDFKKIMEAPKQL